MNLQKSSPQFNTCPRAETQINMSNQLNLAIFTGNSYISKRSIRKILIHKKHYVPMDIEIPDPDTKNTGCTSTVATSSPEKHDTNQKDQNNLCVVPAEAPSQGFKEEDVADMEAQEESGQTCDASSFTHSEANQKVTKDQYGPEGKFEEHEMEISLLSEKPFANPSVFTAMKKRGMKGDTENRPFKCTHCNWAFKKSSNLLSHIETHSGLKPHVCDMCGKTYSHQGTLQQHKRLHTGERPYHCPFCEKTYIWSSDFRKHIRTHTGEKPYNCKDCGKDFVRSSDLRKHERNMHGNNKPFLCKQCGRTFNKPLSLLRHERTHLGERPFSCSDCGKSFALLSRMKEHMKIHSGERPFTCSVCSKAFTKASNLAEHLMVHSGSRPHKCPECGEAFAVASRLATHRRVHLTDMSFGQSAALTRHQKKHCKDAFMCQQCGKSFSQDSLLTEHMLSHHAGHVVKP